MGRVIRSGLPKRATPATRDHRFARTYASSSAAVRQWYEKDDLVGRLVVCVTNFPPRRIATFDSEVLTLGAVQGDGRVVLLKPDADAEPGSTIA